MAGLSQLGEDYLAKLTPRDPTEHEVLPLLRRALNEARDGAPTGARAEAIRGIVLFMAAREPERAEIAFRTALVDDPQSGATRLAYAKLLIADGRFQEARFQLEQAKGKGVSNAQLDAARGALLFREG